KTNQTATDFARETKEEWKACVAALYGEFTATYRADEYQVNAALKRVCDNDESKASIVNAFYVRHFIEYDFKIASAQGQTDLEEAQLKKEKAQFLQHYQQLRNGQIKAKDFWDKCFKKDVALCVLGLQAALKTH